MLVGVTVDNENKQIKLTPFGVSTDYIADAAVTSSKIGSSAVTASKISNGAVTSLKINDNAVTSAKIADNAVTSAKFASDVSTYVKVNQQKYAGTNGISVDETNHEIGISSNFVENKISSYLDENEYITSGDLSSALNDIESLIDNEALTSAIETHNTDSAAHSNLERKFNNEHNLDANYISGNIDANLLPSIPENKISGIPSTIKIAGSQLSGSRNIPPSTLPWASTTEFGVVKISNGLSITNGVLSTKAATTSEINAWTNNNNPIVPGNFKHALSTAFDGMSGRYVLDNEITLINGNVISSFTLNGDVKTIDLTNDESSSTDFLMFKIPDFKDTEATYNLEIKFADNDAFSSASTYTLTGNASEFKIGDDDSASYVSIGSIPNGITTESGGYSLKFALSGVDSTKKYVAYNWNIIKALPAYNVTNASTGGFTGIYQDFGATANNSPVYAKDSSHKMWKYEYGTPAYISIQKSGNPWYAGNYVLSSGSENSTGSVWNNNGTILQYQNNKWIIPSDYYYKVEGSDEVNGNYSLFYGNHGTNTAIYKHESKNLYLESDLREGTWGIYSFYHTSMEDWESEPGPMFIGLYVNSTTGLSSPPAGTYNQGPEGSDSSCTVIAIDSFEVTSVSVGSLTNPTTWNNSTANNGATLTYNAESSSYAWVLGANVVETGTDTPATAFGYYSNGTTLVGTWANGSSGQATVSLTSVLQPIPGTYHYGMTNASTPVFEDKVKGVNADGMFVRYIKDESISANVGDWLMMPRNASSNTQSIALPSSNLNDGDLIKITIFGQYDSSNTSSNKILTSQSSNIYVHTLTSPLNTYTLAASYPGTYTLIYCSSDSKVGWHVVDFAREGLLN